MLTDALTEREVARELDGGALGCNLSPPDPGQSRGSISLGGHSASRSVSASLNQRSEATGSFGLVPEANAQPTSDGLSLGLLDATGASHLSTCGLPLSGDWRRPTRAGEGSSGSSPPPVSNLDVQQPATAQPPGSAVAGGRSTL